MNPGLRMLMKPMGLLLLAFGVLLVIRILRGKKRNYKGAKDS